MYIYIYIYIYIYLYIYHLTSMTIKLHENRCKFSQMRLIGILQDTVSLRTDIRYSKVLPHVTLFHVSKRNPTWYLNALIHSPCYDQ